MALVICDGLIPNRTYFANADHQSISDIMYQNWRFFIVEVIILATNDVEMYNFYVYYFSYLMNRVLVVTS